MRHPRASTPTASRSIPTWSGCAASTCGQARPRRHELVAVRHRGTPRWSPKWYQSRLGKTLVAEGAGWIARVPTADAPDHVLEIKAPDGAGPSCGDTPADTRTLVVVSTAIRVTHEREDHSGYPADRRLRPGPAPNNASRARTSLPTRRLPAAGQGGPGFALREAGPGLQPAHGGGPAARSPRSTGRCTLPTWRRPTSPPGTAGASARSWSPTGTWTAKLPMPPRPSTCSTSTRSAHPGRPATWIRPPAPDAGAGVDDPALAATARRAARSDLAVILADPQACGMTVARRCRRAGGWRWRTGVSSVRSEHPQGGAGDRLALAGHHGAAGMGRAGQSDLARRLGSSAGEPLRRRPAPWSTAAPRCPAAG